MSARKEAIKEMIESIYYEEKQEGHKMKQHKIQYSLKIAPSFKQELMQAKNDFNQKHCVKLSFNAFLTRLLEIQIKK